MLDCNRQGGEEIDGTHSLFNVFGAKVAVVCNNKDKSAKISAMSLKGSPQLASFPVSISRS